MSRKNRISSRETSDLLSLATYNETLYSNHDGLRIINANPLTNEESPESGALFSAGE